MSLRPKIWAKAYRPLHPLPLTVQLLILVVAEIGLFATYSVHDARFHWATHFLVALTVAALLLLTRLVLTGAPGPRFMVLVILGVHLFAMAPDLLFRGGVPHSPWMDLFLGHIWAHSLPGGDGSWLLIALTATASYVAVLSCWLRARRKEAAVGMPPGVGLTGRAVLRPQFDPRAVPLAAEIREGDAAPTIFLLHGLGASAAFWRPVAEELQTLGIATVSPNLLGFGGSIRVGTHFHLDDQAAAVIRLIVSRGQSSVLLVGHSFGAAVAARVALDRPDLISSLVLVQPAVFADAAAARKRIGRRNWLAAKAMNGSPVAGVVCGIMCLFRWPLTALTPRLAHHIAATIPADVARGAVTYVWPAYRDALASLLDDNPLLAWFASPSTPTTVIVGNEDRTVVAAEVAALLGPKILLERFSGSHALPLEHPAAVAVFLQLHSFGSGPLPDLAV